MDYNSKGWQAFRRRVPHKVRLVLGWSVWVAALLPAIIVSAAVGAFRGAKEEVSEFFEYWPRGNK